MGMSRSVLRGALRLAGGAALVALLAGQASAQNAVFSGRVTSEGTPLGGASVGIPELGVGAVTSVDGRYNFTLDMGKLQGRSVNLIARSIGFKPKRLPLVLSVGRVEKDFELERDVLNLEQVVVTGVSGATSQKKTAFAVTRGRRLAAQGCSRHHAVGFPQRQGRWGKCRDRLRSARGSAGHSPARPHQHLGTHRSAHHRRRHHLAAFPRRHLVGGHRARRGDQGRRGELALRIRCRQRRGPDLHQARRQPRRGTDVLQRSATSTDRARCRERSRATSRTRTRSVQRRLRARRCRESRDQG